MILVNLYKDNHYTFPKRYLFDAEQEALAFADSHKQEYAEISEVVDERYLAGLEITKNDESSYIFY